MQRTRLHTIGTGAAVLEPPHETSCYVINRDLLVDLGWCGVLKMPTMGLSPGDIKTVVITHCHSDHILGLPSLLLFRSLSCTASALEIIGPAGYVEKVVEAALKYVAVARQSAPPEVLITPLAPGGQYKNANYLIETCPAIHPISGLCLRVTDLRSHATIAFSGDTAYNTRLVKLAHGVDVLVHEATLGAEAPADDRDGHCGGKEAALVAREAQVGQLLLTHMPRSRRLPALTGALPHFAATALAEDGDVVEILHGFQGQNYHVAEPD